MAVLDDAVLTVARMEGTRGLDVPGEGRTVVSVSAVPGVPGLVDVVLDDGLAYQVLVADGAVVRERSLALFGRWLRDIAFLRRRQLDLETLSGLLDTYGERPMGFANINADYAVGRCEPSLRWGWLGARLTVYAPWSRPRTALEEALGVMGASPYQTYLRATLHIGWSYRLCWKVERVDVPTATAPTRWARWRRFDPTKA